jgi:hypothetical protein
MMVYFASEVKPYALDVLVSAALLVLALDALEKPLDRRRILALALAGAVAPWFSFPAVFVLAGAGLVLHGVALRSRDRHRIVPVLLATLVWAVSVAVLYATSLHQLTTNTRLVALWRDGFVPFPPRSWDDVLWFGLAAVELSDDLLGLFPPGVGVPFLAIGAASLLASRPAAGLLLLAPTLLGLAASAFHRYPFAQRLFLYVAPTVAVLIAEGAHQVRVRLRPHVPAAGALVLLLILGFPLVHAAHQLVEPRRREEVRPLLEYVRQRQRPGDVLYVYYGAECAFTYYGPLYRFQPEEVVLGVAARERWRDYARQIELLRGRVWVLVSHVYTRRGVDEERLLLHFLEGRGRQLDARRAPGAAVYLYDLGG